MLNAVERAWEAVGLLRELDVDESEVRRARQDAGFVADGWNDALEAAAQAVERIGDGMTPASLAAELRARKQDGEAVGRQLLSARRK